MRRSCCIILIILITNDLCAQSSYNFHQIFLDKGLSDVRVNAITEDKYGFMWFATPNGLNRYDGYIIKRFFADGTQKALPSNNINCLFNDSKGDLWIGTASGFVKFDFSNEYFIRADTAQEAARELSRSAINDFEQDKKGNIYVAASSGLFKYENAEKKWINMSRELKVADRLRLVKGLKILNETHLYAITTGNLPFFEYDMRKNRIDSIYWPPIITNSTVKDPNIFAIEKLNDEELLLGFLSIGIGRLNVKTRKYTFPESELRFRLDIQYNSIYDILKDHVGRVWLSSFYFRLAEFLPAENKVILLKEETNSPFAFEGRSAVSLYEDNKHNIWVGTAAHGVFRFNPKYAAVKYYSQNENDKDQLQKGLVLNFMIIDSNHLLIGTEKGPSIYDRRTGKYKNYKGVAVNNLNAPLEYAQSALPDKNGIVWIGSNRLGLMRYDMKTESFRCFSRVTRPHPFPWDGIADMQFLSENKIIHVGYGRVGIFDTRTLIDSFNANDSTNPLFKLPGIGNLSIDGNNHVWLTGTSGELYEYDPMARKVTNRTSLLPVADYRVIYKIACHNNNIFIATNTGIIRIDADLKATNFAINFPVNTINEIKNILPDGDHIWFCSNHLLGRLDPGNGKILILGEKEGLSNVPLISRSLGHSFDGKILIGTNKGYYEINPKQLAENTSSAAPYLTHFRIYDKPLQVEGGITGATEIRLGPNQNFFSFDMSAFDFDEAEDIEYAYMLEEFDKDWTYIGKSRSGSYTNVPGGNYVLKLKTKNASGRWNETGQQLKIQISKPLSATLLFRLLLLGFISLLVYLFYRYRIQRINKEARLRSDYEIKLNELENSALRTQMNPHFIFNSLNTINSFINNNDRAQANQYISKFSKLVRLILDHSRQKKITLKDELEVAQLYMQLEQIRFQGRFDFEINITGIEPQVTEVPPLIIQPFIENGILHGLLPSEKHGLLKITIGKEQGQLLCIIEDNGIGRAAAKKIKDQAGYLRQSHGMEITMKRIELFNKENGSNLQVRITDLQNQDKEPSGTRVEIPLVLLETF